MTLCVCWGTFAPQGHPCGKAHDLTGDYKVPILVPDDGSVVDGSQNIIDWADEHDA